MLIEPVPAAPPGIEPGPKGCSLSPQIFSRMTPKVSVVLRFGLMIQVLMMDTTCAPESRCSVESRNAGVGVGRQRGIVLVEVLEASVSFDVAL